MCVPVDKRILVYTITVSGRLTKIHMNVYKITLVNDTDIEFAKTTDSKYCCTAISLCSYVSFMRHMAEVDQCVFDTMYDD